uniref:Leucine-rich repeat-containing N-terminal plant-type domain-containing protein n=1 Tax=Oryza nivara TaxID=4536 RepID=A0A0E0HGP4_ORYNI
MLGGGHEVEDSFDPCFTDAHTVSPSRTSTPRLLASASSLRRRCRPTRPHRRWAVASSSVRAAGDSALIRITCGSPDHLQHIQDAMALTATKMKQPTMATRLAAGCTLSLELVMKITAIGLFLLVLIASCPVQIFCSSSYGNETDKLSLLEFKKAISLDPQQALISWNDTNHFCSWEGVSCRKKTPLRVNSLDLSNRGEIPLSLGHLHHLQTLYLSNNTLEGRIPDFTNCSSLEILLLNGNHLAGQLNNSFPSQLQNLLLAENNLTGTIPSSLANITGLRGLSFMSNNIKGNIPNEFSKFVMMELLAVSGNMLSGRFPQPILNLSTLTNLYLTLNHLSGEVPSDLLDSLPNLQELLLGHNFFRGHIPLSLGNTSNLRLLDISNNNFTGIEISSGFFPSGIEHLSDLNSLGLDNNELTVIPSSVSNLSQLAVLGLYSNKLEGHIPSFVNLQMLQLLVISSNNLHVSIPKEIFSIPSIIAIDLSFNNLDGQLPTEIGNAKQLVSLGLSSNKLFGDIPNSLVSCESLEYIAFDSNILSGGIPTSLGSMKERIRLSTQNEEEFSLKFFNYNVLRSQYFIIFLILQ